MLLRQNKGIGALDALAFLAFLEFLDVIDFIGFLDYLGLSMIIKKKQSFNFLWLKLCFFRMLLFLILLFLHSHIPQREAQEVGLFLEALC